MKELNEVDRRNRREARQHGHTHAIAVGAAHRADGRTVGRVSA